VSGPPGPSPRVWPLRIADVEPGPLVSCLCGAEAALVQVAGTLERASGPQALARMIAHAAACQDHHAPEVVGELPLRIVDGADGPWVQCLCVIGAPPSTRSGSACLCSRPLAVARMIMHVHRCPRAQNAARAAGLSQAGAR
jgi:hypothetical protein